jgi:hypothetical protein
LSVVSHRATAAAVAVGFDRSDLLFDGMWALLELGYSEAD